MPGRLKSNRWRSTSRAHGVPSNRMNYWRVTNGNGLRGMEEKNKFFAANYANWREYFKPFVKFAAKRKPRIKKQPDLFEVGLMI
jgi:hypothetical protein